MNYLSKIVKILSASFFITLFSLSPLFCQQEDFSDEDILELLENENNPHSNIEPELQKNFVVLETIRPHDLNPHTTSYSSDSQILSGLYEGLFSYNPVTLEPQYAITTSYQISRDKLRWSFKIRDNAFFSNGEKITADSVRDSWIQLLSTEGAPYASLLDIIKNAQDFRNNKCTADKVGIYASSEDTLTIHLNKPANYLPKVLCHSAFSVIHRNPTVYSGPFSLYDQDTYITVLEKNPFYWDNANTHLEKITFVQSNDIDENTFLYNTGAIDWISSGDVNTQNILNKQSVQMNAEFGISYLFFKINNSKTDSDKFNPWVLDDFRQVLLEATPWTQLKQNMIVPANTFVFPLNNYPEVDGLSYTDLNEAKILLDNAKSKYSIPDEEKIPLIFEISENSFSNDFLVALSDAYTSIGIDLQIRTVPAAYYINNIPYSNADMFSYVWIGDFADPLAFLELFRGDSTLNVSGWKNERFDELLDKAAVAKNTDRYSLLAEAEGILLDSGMVLPIYHPVSFNVIDLESVGGWSLNAFDLHPLKYIFKKKVENKIPNVVLRK